MKMLAALVALSSALVPAAAQAPQLTSVDRYADGSCGGVLVDAAASTAFCLEVTRHRAELWLDARHEGADGARRVAPGSDEEQAFLRRLQQWGKAAFDDELRARIEAADDVHHRGQGWSFASFDRYKEAAVLNRLALYRRIHAATITDVIRGRGTVRLSLKVRDGLGAARLVTFRRLEQTALRMHFGDAQQPVAYDSVDERFVLQAMRAYIEKNIPARGLELLWQGAKLWPMGASRDAMAVFAVLKEYCWQSSPRLANAFYVKDGGSTIYALVDMRSRAYEVKFDKAIGSTTIGRMYERQGKDEWQLVALGSDREAELLAGFRSLLARIGERDRPMLAGWLERYAKLQAEAKIKGKRS